MIDNRSRFGSHLRVTPLTAPCNIPSYAHPASLCAVSCLAQIVQRPAYAREKPMSIQNSVTRRSSAFYSIDELKEQANLMRGYDLAALCAATSGHAAARSPSWTSPPRSTFASPIMIQEPQRPDRDRIVWSTGHKAPSLYLGLAFAGFARRKTWPPAQAVFAGFRGIHTGSNCRRRSLDRVAWPGA